MKNKLFVCLTILFNHYSLLFRLTMAAILSNFSDYFKNNSLTGNAIIDTLIMTSLIPIIIAWGTNVFTFINTSFHIFFENYWYMIYKKYKSYFYKQTIFKTQIFECDKLFNTFSTILKSDVEFEDEIKDQSLSSLFKKKKDTKDQDLKIFYYTSKNDYTICLLFMVIFCYILRIFSKYIRLYDIHIGRGTQQAINALV